MSERLREHMMRGRISPVQARAGAAWQGDWLTCGRLLQLSDAAGAGECTNSAASGGDVMRVAARQRLRRVEATLGGRAAPWYRVAHHIVLLDKEAREVADLLEITPRSVMDVLRLALSEVASLYRLREVA